jgi:hypothetical protein
MTVADLIALLQEYPQDARVLTAPSSAQTRSLCPKIGEGFDGNFGFVLDENYCGFEEAQECRFFLMMPGEILACLLCLGDRR